MLKSQLLFPVLLVSACFQQEAPRLATPVPVPAAVTEAPGVAELSGRDLATTAREDADPAVRREAIYVIADVETTGIESAALVGEALFDPDPDVRMAAIEALTGVRSASSADWLSIALGDPEPRVRRTAVEALGEIGGANARFLLEQALGDVDSSVRETAQEMLDELQRAGSGVS